MQVSTCFLARALVFATSATTAPAGERSSPAATLLAARSREVGVATEMLLTKAEQVSDDRACAPDYASRCLTRLSRRGAPA